MSDAFIPYTASVDVRPNGSRRFTLRQGERVVDTRTSKAPYSHIVVIDVMTGDPERPIVEYAGRLDLAEKRVSAYLARDAKRSTPWVVSTHIVPVGDVCQYCNDGADWRECRHI